MKKLLSLTLVATVVLLNGFMLFEGGFASAANQTVTTTVTGIGGAVNLQYPVELTVDAELTLTCDTATSTMMPNIPGMTGGTATSSRLCNVKTNNYGGYTMTAAATTSPALARVGGGDSFGDYAGTTSTWQTPGTASSSFGFEPTGSDAAIGWTGFNGTNTITVASRTSPTLAAGVDTTMNYQAEVGATRNQATGLYRSWTTITAYMN